MLEHTALGVGLLTSSAPMPPPKGSQVQVGTRLPLQLLLPLQLHLWPHALMARPTASFPAEFCKQQLVLLYRLQSLGTSNSLKDICRFQQEAGSVG